MITIQGREGDARTESFAQGEVNLGRIVGNDVVLPKGNVSRHHARILFRDGRFIITDLKSSSGTYVNGRRIVQATILTAADRITIGDFLLRCSAMEQTVDDAPLAPAPVLPEPSQPPSLPEPGEPRPSAPDLFHGRVVVEASSRITRVLVHARGALVTREVDLPADLRAGIVEVMIGGITPLAQGGSVRAALAGSTREVVQIETALHHAAQTPTPGPTRSRVRDIEERIARLRDESSRLTRRRETVSNIQLAPPIRTIDRRQVQRDGLDTRLGDALRLGELMSQTTARVDEALLVVRRDLEAAQRELEAARLEDMQTSSVERLGEDHPTRAIVVRLRGEGPPGTLTLTYAVPAARFWPTYTLRLSDGGKRASWAFEAIVAQRSGEDWSGVPLSLSTGDLAFDARLPQLTSLRIGRRAPPQRAAFRPPPEGIDAMFAFYLAFAATTRGGQPPPESHAYDSDSEEQEGDRPTPMFLQAAERESGSLGMAPPADDELVSILSASAAPPQAMLRMSAPSMSAPVAPRGGASGGGGGGEYQKAYWAPEASDEADVVPSGAWDDYDNLVLAAAEDVSARGRLVAVGDPDTALATRLAVAAIEHARVPGHTDPLASRGVFDHRYDADGLCDVPSDGRVHRVPIQTAACGSRIHYTTVPVEAAEVYREAVFVNPFASPLLAGPVDVYLDGTLLTTARMSHTDRGGDLRVGMGVDDRFKVARNVRTSEESAGLIGGSLAVTHNVSIEVSASVRDAVSVTVLERIPVTDDKAVKIELAAERPSSTPYDQSDRGAAVRGARRFELTLEPGRKGLIELVYRLTFSNKLDVVGGSRRV